MLKRLGTAVEGITLDVYSHVLPHPQEEAAAKMDGRLASRQKALGYSLGYSPVRNRR